MDLDDLRLIAAVTETGSLTRAAARLEITLNVASRRLQRLEASAGVRLVQRTTRRLALTEAGERLYRHAVAALAHVDAALADLGDERAEPVGTVRVVLPSSAVTEGLLGRLGRLRGDHPRLQVRLLVTARPGPLAPDVDLAVSVGAPPDQAGVAARRAASIRWALCASPAYVATRGLPCTPADLTSHECLRFRGDAPQSVWTLEDDAGERVSVPVSGGFESDDSRVLGDATYAGLGVGIRPGRELEAAVAGGRLLRVLPGWWFATTPVFVVGPPARQRLPAVRVVADALTEALLELG